MNPEITQTQVDVLHALEAPMKQMLGVQLLEIRNHLLIHGLQDRDSVWRPVDLNEAKFL